MNRHSLSTDVVGWVILALALGAGFSVASIYYSQPLLPLMGSDLHLTVNGMGLVPTLTQAGYALGILFLLPLGDRHDRRRLILIKSVALAILLLACSLTSNLPSLLLVSLMLGMAATMAQDIVPAAAILAPAGKQGKMVGTVMTGLLLGILLSRTVSGFVGAAFGWRVMYQLAAVSIALIGVLMWSVLPRFATHSTLSYPALMKSMAHLWQRYPALRRAAFAQGFLSIAFSAFWSTLAVMLLEKYQLGSAVAGTFGIAGAAGALAAPLAGGLADKVGAEKVTQLGAGLVTLSFALMFLLPALPPHAQLILIALSAVGFDLGLQSSLVAHQNLVYGLEPQARGRLNALLFTGVFIGMAVGSALGSKLYSVASWQGVVVLATLSGFIALVIRLVDARRIQQAAQKA
ncbi:MULTISPECIES: MFS transporter [Kosakonia]|uniref:Predicted arabinose efflux permease, MFS family n=1 Tax=Kosakonia radicincitans TaxID=283686 RepID=A0AAX2EVK8_9ENTR|nr:MULTISPECIES: MFS transporter [Kosakonia]MDP9569052.1 putative MFS family arabinose efflux permease [Kosakonia oryzae]MDD7998344.1 MFS transporter [Kosakonia radicincitans]NCF04039.1 MFS transporter [Kosakonia sp. MH5]PTA93041.1 MFS transporter [Kosakonia sp. H7A]SES99850.1 Predicted arabinose efflux permease, MFS family [Kosakonia radicincitans]